MTGVTYDAGALIAAERRNPRMVTFHEWIVNNGIRPVVPAGVLAQVWRDGSGRQAPLAQTLKQCQVEPLDENLAKQVGAASHKTGSSDVVDISVVVSAIGRGGQNCHQRRNRHHRNNDLPRLRPRNLLRLRQGGLLWRWKFGLARGAPTR